jgi:hypothetical protein
MTKITPFIVPKPEDVNDALADDKVDAEQALLYVQDLEVETDQDIETSVKILAEIKEKHKEIEDKRKSFTAPLEKLKKELNAFFKPATDSLKKCEKTIKDKISECSRRRDEQRASLLSSVKHKAPEQKEDALSLIEQADSLRMPKVEGLSTREKWTGEVESMQQIIDWAIVNNRFEVLLVNEKALMAITVAMNADPEIPGWNAKKTTTVAITASKVK